MDDPPQALDHATYKEVRAVWVDVASDQQKFIDQTILALAGGALGLSLTFLHDFGAPPRMPYMLYLGGGALVISIILVLVSLHASQLAIDRHIADLDAAARASFSPESSRAFLAGRYVNRAARLTHHINRAASVALVLGVALVAIFAYANLTQAESGHWAMQKIQTVPRDSTGIERGVVPSKPAIAPPPKPAPSQQSQTTAPKS